MTGCSPGVGAFPCLVQLLFILHVFLCLFPGVFAFHGHTGVCSGLSLYSAAVYSLSTFLHPDFHYTICYILKTAGVYYGLMYVKISLP
jgi:hypothetical protein